MDTILIVEDDKLDREIIKRSLAGEESFLLLEASNGKRMNEILEKHQVDIVLLDLMLPDGNGIDFIQDIRSHTNVPIIICSANDETESMVDALDFGADDYIQKPLDKHLFTARLNANLRRYKAARSADNSTNQINPNDIFCFSHWHFDRVCMQMYDDNKVSCGLTVREFQLLDILISNINQPVTRHDLCEAIQEDNYVPTPRSIDVKITRIRKKIGDDANNPEIIKTVRGVGYMFHQQET